MRAWAVLLRAGFVAWALPCVVWAQDVQLAESAAVRCLTPVAADRGAPDYPDNAWRHGVAGRMLVELTFHHPQASPFVQVLERQASDELVDAVREHVRGFRVPCLAVADGPVRLRQEYVFSPSYRGVQATAPTDAADLERRRMLKCLRTLPGAQPPDYPAAALRKELQGRVVVQMRFDAADQPPQVKVHARPSAEVFRTAAEAWARQQRVPCHTGGPLESEATLIYRLDPSPNFGFRDVSLRQFVGAVRGIRSQQLHFDFGDMACPFRLRLNYRQPALRNTVTDIDPPHPARTAFMEWLRNAELVLNDKLQDAVFADSLVLDVPCGQINLQPAVPPTETPSSSPPSPT